MQKLVLTTGRLSVLDGVETVRFFKELTESSKKTRVTTQKTQTGTTIKREVNVPLVGKVTLLENHEYKKTSQFFLKI